MTAKIIRKRQNDQTHKRWGKDTAVVRCPDFETDLYPMTEGQYIAILTHVEGDFTTRPRSPENEN